jgi:hypothetical protein
MKRVVPSFDGLLELFVICKEKELVTLPRELHTAGMFHK